MTVPVIDITKDLDAREITITAEFAAPVERVWALYADPRQLEQVWGPPSHPATFAEHDLAPGSRSLYYMTGPAGERFSGWWQIKEVDEPRSFTFDDGFAHDDFTPNEDLPVSHNVYRFEAVDGGTRLTSSTVYDSAEALQTVLDMGMEEGATLAINQIDEFLAKSA
ncbi:SRPBCC family protein [Arsenicicoccus piscis]|uniref:SRPBCC family protein n=1 Tax=Arsenicicoccus piscis TaxID=673954 RepID=UPI0024092264|nr:SRPBCC domain-containing protein [Arsenicicoccus piscis]